MAKGIQITTGVDVKYARDDDYVVNTKFLGGMKISEKKTFIPGRDFTTKVTDNYFQIVYPHKLNYVPAIVAFQGGFQSVGWQNDAVINNVSANADNRNVYMISDYYLPDRPITLIIFQEKVSDV